MSDSSNCGCATCLDLQPPVVLGSRGFTIPQSRMRMVVCANCGCKRCPHAANHKAECTGQTGNGGHTCSGCTENSARLDAAIRDLGRTKE